MIIPDEICEHNQLAPGAKLVYGYLFRVAKQHQQDPWLRWLPTPDRSSMARRLGLGVRTVSMHLKKLAEENLLNLRSRCSEFSLVPLT